MNFAEAYDPIRALKSAFAAMNRAPVRLWLGGILILILDGNVGTGSNSVGQNAQHMDPALAIGLLSGACCLGLLIFIASAWITPGVLFGLREVLQDGELGERGMFEHRGRFVPLLLSRLLVSVLVVCVFVVIAGGTLVIVLLARSLQTLSLPMVLLAPVMLLAGLAALISIIYIFLGFYLMEGAVVFEERSPVEALKRSWSLVRGNRWRLVWFGLVSVFVTLLGLVACCVGVIATGAVARLAAPEAFLRLTADEGTTWAAPGAKA
jgi:hypothetical protein